MGGGRRTTRVIWTGVDGCISTTGLPRPDCGCWYCQEWADDPSFKEQHIAWANDPHFFKLYRDNQDAKDRAKARDALYEIARAAATADCKKYEKIVNR